MRKFTLVLVSGLAIDKRPQGRVIPLPNVNVLALGGFVEPDEIASGDLVKRVAQTMKNANAYNISVMPCEYVKGKDEDNESVVNAQDILNDIVENALTYLSDETIKIVGKATEYLIEYDSEWNPTIDKIDLGLKDE
jgi:hypothetical protein